MLEQLMSMEKDARNKILDNLPVGMKKYIFDSIPVMSKDLMVKETDSWEDRVEKKYKCIQENPNEVFWDNAEFYPLVYKNKSNQREPGFLANTKISTRGDIIRFYPATGRIFLTLAGESPKGVYVRVRIDKLKYPVHRIVGSTFIPIPDQYKDTDISRLITNHKDLVVTNNYVSNLEWLDDSGNIRHAQDNGAKLVGEDYYKTKPILIEVVADNRFKGRKYVLQGFGHCKENGLNYTSLMYVINGDKKHNYGHIASFIPLEDVQKYHLGMPNDIKELFDKNVNYFSMDIIPVVGTVLSGEFEGLEFSLFGATEINEHFVQANVLKVCNGKRKSHRNCSWKQVSLEEGIRLHGLLTKEVLKTLQ